MEQEESIVHVDVPDSGACLVVGRGVGKLVVVAERFAGMAGADASGDVEFLVCDVIPYAVDGVDVGGIACYGGHIGHAGIHVGCSDGMTHGFALLRYRKV